MQIGAYKPEVENLQIINLSCAKENMLEDENLFSGNIWNTWTNWDHLQSWGYFLQEIENYRTKLDKTNYVSLK